MTKLSASAKRGRVVAAKVTPAQRARAVAVATSRVAAKATLGRKDAKASTARTEGAPVKQAG